VRKEAVFFFPGRRGGEKEFPSPSQKKRGRNGYWRMRIILFAKQQRKRKGLFLLLSRKKKKGGK